MNFDISKFLSTLDGTEQDAWRKSKFYAWQSQGNKQKGITGENMIAEYLTDAGYINDKQGGGSASYDLCFNGVKIEVKTSFAMKDKGTIVADKFKWQHVGIDKDFDYIVFLGINAEQDLMKVRRGWREDIEEVNILWFSKKDIEKFISEGSMTIQQGGASSDNDDYWTSANFFKEINYGKDYKEIPF